MTYFYGIDFHQDLIDYKDRDADFLTLYVYLHPVARADAPLYLLEGSHRLGGTVFPHDLDAQRRRRLALRDRSGGEVGDAPEMLTGGAGFAAMWHACTLHGTQPDAADHERISLRYLFAKPPRGATGLDEVNATLQGPLEPLGHPRGPRRRRRGRIRPTASTRPDLAGPRGDQLQEGLGHARAALAVAELGAGGRPAARAGPRRVSSRIKARSKAASKSLASRVRDQRRPRSASACGRGALVLRQHQHQRRQAKRAALPGRGAGARRWRCRPRRSAGPCAGCRRAGRCACRAGRSC